MARPSAQHIGKGTCLDPIGTKVRNIHSLDRDFPVRPSGWPFKDPYDFMEGKKQDDGVPGHLWRIHDNYYDLHDFKHPGGDQWLSLTQGTDITELFEIHHLNMDKVKAMLPAYLDSQDEPLPKRRSPFTFEPNGFYCTLRRKIWTKYGGKKRQPVTHLGPSPVAKNFADVLVLASAFITLATGKARNLKLAAASAIANGILNGAFIGIGHNFMHQKDNFRRHYMNLSGFSSAEFRMHHALSHHPYTNTVQDAELNQLLPDVSFFPGAKTPEEALRARVVLSIVCSLATPLLQFRRLVSMSLGNWPGTRVDYLAQALPLAQFAILSTMRGSIKGGMSLWALMLTTTSTLFLWGNFLNGPHFNDECWHQGDTLDSTDWGLLQVQTNVERSALSTKNKLSANLINIAVFGLHHLHHLFPTIDAAHLSEIVPIFEEHCKEWGVTFKTMSDEELAAGLWKCIGGYADNHRTRNGVHVPTSKL